MFVRFFVVYASSKQGIPDTAPYKTERYWEQFCRLHYGSNTHQMVDEKTHKGVLCFVALNVGVIGYKITSGGTGSIDITIHGWF